MRLVYDSLHVCCRNKMTGFHAMMLCSIHLLSWMAPHPSVLYLRVHISMTKVTFQQSIVTVFQGEKDEKKKYKRDISPWPSLVPHSCARAKPRKWGSYWFWFIAGWKLQPIPVYSAFRSAVAIFWRFARALIIKIKWKISFLAVCKLWLRGPPVCI